MTKPPATSRPPNRSLGTRVHITSPTAMGHSTNAARATAPATLGSLPVAVISTVIAAAARPVALTTDASRGVKARAVR
ncbi:MAG TPA: hypothetical protein VI318_14400 [Baekduia sp.]